MSDAAEFYHSKYRLIKRDKNDHFFVYADISSPFIYTYSTLLALIVLHCVFYFANVYWTKFMQIYTELKDYHLNKGL